MKKILSVDDEAPVGTLKTRCRNKTKSLSVNPGNS